MDNPQKAELLCVERLVARQLPEGGWPFRSGAIQAAVEPTALALLALPPTLLRERDCAIHFLLRTQKENGSWPSFSNDSEGESGFTGLIASTLYSLGANRSAADRAVHWLLQSRGWESHWLWKWKFRTTDRHVRFDPDRFGWPWMPETASWVVPTAYSLLALKRARGTSQQKLLEFRVRRGVEMLYDRVCPGGGWNAGNGVVYGIPLAPHPDATAVALLALLGEPFNDCIPESLNWLERRAESLLAPWSLSWTILTLDAFRRPTRPWVDRLCTGIEPAQIHDCGTLAAVCLALRTTSGPSVFAER